MSAASATCEWPIRWAPACCCRPAARAAAHRRAGGPLPGHRPAPHRRPQGVLHPDQLRPDCARTAGHRGAQAGRPRAGVPLRPGPVPRRPDWTRPAMEELTGIRLKLSREESQLTVKLTAGHRLTEGLDGQTYSDPPRTCSPVCYAEDPAATTLGYLAGRQTRLGGQGREGLDCRILLRPHASGPPDAEPRPTRRRAHLYRYGGCGLGIP